MYGRTSSALLTMKCDVYVQENKQDPSTGAIMKAWIFHKTITCHVDVISHTGGTAGKDNTKTFSDTYVEEERYLLKTQERLSKRYRISNIRNRTGSVLFTEIDRIENPPTIFEIEAHHPRFDPLGNVLYYESNMRRVGVQTYDAV